MRLGNALAEAMVVLASVQARLGRFVQFEQPARSLMLAYPSVLSMMKEFKFVAYQRDACVDGAPWRKPLLIVTPTSAVGRRLSATCPGGHDHIVLRGPSPQGGPWTRVAAPDWHAWTGAIVAAWRPTLQRELASRDVSRGRPWHSDVSPPEIAGAGTPTVLLSHGASFDTFNSGVIRPIGSPVG